MSDLLKRLCEAWGPSGYEHHVRRLIETEVAAYADEVRVDGIGNLIVRVGNRGPKVMVVVHMDEIGVMATFAEPSTGVLRFAAVGGLTVHDLVGQRVQFEDGTLGVIGAHQPYKNSNPKLDELYIDTGGAPVAIGQPAAFVHTYAEQGEIRLSKAMDDRAGCAVVIEAIQALNKKTPNQVYFVFSVQEEVGLRGAGPAAFGIAPDVAIAVDVTDTGDMPKGEKTVVKLGQGAGIKVYDPGLVVPRAVIDWMVSTAEQAGIPYQIDMIEAGTTDAARVQLAGSGVPSGAVTIPCRYIHSQSEMVHARDLQACTDLLVALLKTKAEISV